MAEGPAGLAGSAPFAGAVERVALPSAERQDAVSLNELIMEDSLGKKKDDWLGKRARKVPYVKGIPKIRPANTLKRTPLRVRLHSHHGFSENVNFREPGPLQKGRTTAVTERTK